MGYSHHIPTGEGLGYAVEERREGRRVLVALYISVNRAGNCGSFSVLFTRKEFDVELALKSSIKTLVASFGGFYLGAYLLNEAWQGLFKREKDMKLCQRFVGYSSSLMFALNVVLMLLPEFFFLRIFILYTFYIVWEGAGPYMQVEEKERLKFAGITTVIILLTPAVIEFVLFMLMPGLRY